jgi:hypothetical protein
LKRRKPLSFCSIATETFEDQLWFLLLTTTSLDFSTFALVKLATSCQLIVAAILITLITIAIANTDSESKPELTLVTNNLVPHNSSEQGLDC